MQAHRYVIVSDIEALPPGHYMVEDGDGGWIGYQRTEGGWVSVGSEMAQDDEEMIGLQIAGPYPTPERAP